MQTIYYFFPLIGAFTGWCLNRLAGYFVFLPLKPVKVAGIGIQGFIPSFQQKIGEQLSDFASTKILSQGALEQKLSNPEHFEKIRPYVDEKVDEFLRVKLGQQMPMISMFIGDKTIETLKKIFIDELQSIFPQVLQKMAGNLQSELDIRQMISQQFKEQAPTAFVEMVKPLLHKPLQRFYQVGLFSGFIIGLILFLILVLAS